MNCCFTRENERRGLGTVGIDSIVLGYAVYKDQRGLSLSCLAEPSLALNFVALPGLARAGIVQVEAL